MKKTIILTSMPLLICSFILLGPHFVAKGAIQNSAVSPLSSTESSSSLIHIVDPEENAHLPAVSATFVCGYVPKDSKLTINNRSVTIHPGGGFLTMVPLSPGEFKIRFDLQLGTDTYHAVRTIFVAAPEQQAPVSPLTIESISPSLDQELLPGDFVNVSCKGSPGMKAYFTVSGVRKKFPMSESTSAPGGIYQGVFPIAAHDRLKNAKIRVTLLDRHHRKISRRSGSIISVFPHDEPVMVETTSANTVLRAGPAISSNNKAGYLLYPPEGTLLQVTGRIGAEYRVRLSQAKTVWVSADQVKRLPLGTPPPQVVVGNIAINTDRNSTYIRIPLTSKIPFKVDPDVEGKYLDLSLFGAYSNTDVIAHEAAGAVSNVIWSQDDPEIYRLRINTHTGSWWGYDAQFEGDGAHPVLVLELRTPPPVAEDSSPLAGLIIAVDAGHGAGGGAMGVTGFPEGDANMAMALNLKEKLLAKGVKVILTRPGNDDVPLSDRPRIAWQNKADLLISLHNNSCGYGDNPFYNHGFGVYYFTPMSLPLAEAIQQAYRKTFSTGRNPSLSLRDNGLFYDNLALARPAQMPSVLIESAFMIVPEEEAYLKTDAFRSACSDAIIQGLENYVHTMRPMIASPTEPTVGN